MAYTQVILSPDPLYLQPKSYDARADRKWFADIISPGVVGSGDYNVTAATSNMNISVAPGVAYILGQDIAEQGMYRQYSPNAQSLTVGGNNSGNPRIDTVILRVLDNASDSSTYNECRIEIVPGTPTSGANLTNLNGKANLNTLTDSSKSLVVLAYVLVPNNATSLTTASNVKDARVRASVGSGQAFGGVPVGATIEWNAASPPAGGFYLVEDGSAISRSVYSALFNLVGTTFGAGDGSSTFNIPDSRGRVPVGYAPSGGNADVSTMGGTDGLAIGSRRVRHKHTLNLTDPGHTHAYLDDSNPVATSAAYPIHQNWQDHVATRYMQSSVTGITLTVGPQTGAEPTDGPAWIVKNKIIRVA